MDERAIDGTEITFGRRPVRRAVPVAGRAAGRRDSIAELSVDPQIAESRAPGGVERRAHYRRRVLKPGTLFVHAGSGSLDCTVRNLSAGGVLAEIDPLATVPERFTFRLGGDIAKRTAAIAWRQGGRAGFRFL